ncbi:hypothetical protein R3W88_000679 [Solanum pinnatisectum]|uniref:Uncharacterized protein n=1 Tax=Solanum pinnatisectum TaxID=50273 RepID=A0AAV9MI28_9SOLN|nr:hypothetical protein R3W88_000679 [Solanum pinnatisectum]
MQQYENGNAGINGGILAGVDNLQANEDVNVNAGVNGEFVVNNQLLDNGLAEEQNNIANVNAAFNGGILAGVDNLQDNEDPNVNAGDLVLNNQFLGNGLAEEQNNLANVNAPAILDNELNNIYANGNEGINGGILGGVDNLQDPNVNAGFDEDFVLNNQFLGNDGLAGEQNDIANHANAGGILDNRQNNGKNAGFNGAVHVLNNQFLGNGLAGEQNDIANHVNAPAILDNQPNANGINAVVVLNNHVLGGADNELNEHATNGEIVLYNLGFLNLDQMDRILEVSNNIIQNEDVINILDQEKLALFSELFEASIAPKEAAIGMVEAGNINEDVIRALNMQSQNLLRQAYMSLGTGLMEVRNNLNEHQINAYLDILHQNNIFPVIANEQAARGNNR